MHERSTPRIAMLAAAALLASACGGSSTSDPAPALEVACAGPACEASSPSLYSGSGVVVWRYRNATGSPVSLDVSIDGVREGQEPLLLFSNGGSTNTTLPSYGSAPATPATTLQALLQPVSSLRASSRREARHRAEWEMTERNRELALRIKDSPAGEAARLAPATLQAAPAIEVGVTTHDWNETMDPKNVVKYATTAQASCVLPDGRLAIFWVDEETWDGLGMQEVLPFLQKSFCGAAGGYARVTGIRGAPWGLTPTGTSGYIPVSVPGTSDPQPIHLVFLNVPEKAEWAGYFDGTNNELKRDAPAYQANSNEALAFFINGRMLNAAWIDEDSGMIPEDFASTMVHELTHLVNFYQRSIQKRSPYDTWLEEMSAMMTEDMITPLITVDPSFPDGIFLTPKFFVAPYLTTGGAVSLINWGYLGSSYYYVGGSLGAFLNRRYGDVVYREMKDCDGDLKMTGHACVDSIIRRHEGAGLDDEFARLGATIFGRLPVTGTPAGFGFPGRVVSVAPGNEITLRAIDVSVYGQPESGRLDNGFQATSHTFDVDKVPAGKTNYSRSGVSVPPGTEFLLVLKPAPAP